MSVTTGTIRAKATIEAGSNPTIYNVSALLADTEYSQPLNSGTKSFIIKTRGTATLKLAFEPGETATNPITVGYGCAFVQDSILFSGTLYFQTNKPNQVIEILEWV